MFRLLHLSEKPGGAWPDLIGTCCQGPMPHHCFVRPVLARLTLPDAEEEHAARACGHQGGHWRFRLPQRRARRSGARSTGPTARDGIVPRDTGWLSSRYRVASFPRPHHRCRRRVHGLIWRGARPRAPRTGATYDRKQSAPQTHPLPAREDRRDRRRGRERGNPLAQGALQHVPPNERRERQCEGVVAHLSRAPAPGAPGGQAPPATRARVDAPVPLRWMSQHSSRVGRALSCGSGGCYDRRNSSSMRRYVASSISPRA